jgi:hypothetical protein
MNDTESYETTTGATWTWDGCSFEDGGGTEVDCSELGVEFEARTEAMKLVFGVTQDSTNQLGEDDQQRFQFTLGSINAQPRHNFRGEWSCGSAVALNAFNDGKFKMPTTQRLGTGRHGSYKASAKKQFVFGGGLTLDEAADRKEIRIRYKPGVAEIVSSLIMDDRSIDGYSDFLDWAEDFGVEGAMALREARTNFALIQERAPKLRTILGSDFENLQRMAAGL